MKTRTKLLITLVIVGIAAATGPVISRLRDLTDVKLAGTVTSGQALVWNGTQWTNGAAGGGSAGTTNYYDYTLITNNFFISGKGNTLVITQQLTLQYMKTNLLATDASGLVTNAVYGSGIAWDPATRTISSTVTGGLATSGSAYAIVGGSATPSANWTALTNAYSAAKSATPNGAALGANNRYTIFLLPGVYDLGSTTFALDTSYIDLIGLSPNTGATAIANADSATDQGDTIITSSSDTLNITDTTQNITLANLCIRCTSSGSGYFLTTSQTQIQAPFKAINVLFCGAGTSNRSFQWDKGIAGYWQDVRMFGTGNAARCWGASVSSGITLSGTFIRCKGNTLAWGFENSVSVTLSGIFIDCESSSQGFASGGSGTKTLSGTFIRCRSYGDVSFGAATGTMSGYFEGCRGDPSFGNFGGGTMSGTMLNCSGTSVISWTSISGSVVGCNFPGIQTVSMASKATDTPVNIATSGWTNTFAKNATVYIDGTGLTYTVYNNAGTSIYTNAATVIHAEVHLQPSGKVIITAGTGVTGRAVPF